MVSVELESKAVRRAAWGPWLGWPQLALVLATLFWSGNFIAGRALHADISPVALNSARWAIALMLLLPFVGRDLMLARQVLRREWRLVLGLGATGIAAFHTMTYQALQSTTATNALLMLSLAPVATLAGAAMLGMERPTRWQLIGAVIAAFGAAVVIASGTQHLAFRSGDLWMLGGVVTWAAYSLLLRRRPADLPQAVTLAASIIVALALLLPCLLLGSAPVLAPFGSALTLAGVGYIAVFASAIAFLCWSYGVSKLGPTRSSQFIHLMPVFGAALAIGLLGEVPSAQQLVGAAVVFAGIACVECGR